MKSGFVSLIGRPNGGKSTLLNSIIGKKVAITSDKPQTTRNVIQGIYNDENTQIVFIDTPGIHKPTHKLGSYLNKEAYSALEADVILFVIDATAPFGRGDQFVLEKIKEVSIPVILVVNKIDKIKKEELLPMLTAYQDLYTWADIVPVSALKKDNIQELLQTLRQYLPDEVLYYDREAITNKPLPFMISEIIREKAFEKTHEEIPHSLTCIVENIEKKNNTYHIDATLIVDRVSLRKILIGAGGNMIKEIGTNARKELETYLNAKVYLDTRVKVIENWRDKEKYLQEFGFNDFE